MDFSQVLGEFGSNYEIKGWRGRDLRLSFLTGRTKSAFEKWVKQRKLAVIRGLFEEESSTREEFEADRERLIKRAARGELHFWSSECLDEMTTTAGAQALLLCLLREHQPDFSDADLAALNEDRGGEVSDILKLILAEVQGRIEAVQKKAQARAGSSSG